MMLPTDLALVEDKKFFAYVKTYAKFQDEFFKDFATAFGKLISLGKKSKEETVDGQSEASKAFREYAMHGNLIRMKEIEGEPDPNAPENFTKRASLHKSAYFGHDHVVGYILGLGGDVSLQDVDGDTPLHDAARLGHTECVKLLLENGAKANVKNRKGETPLDLASKLDVKDSENLLKKSKGGIFC